MQHITSALSLLYAVTTHLRPKYLVTRSISFFSLLWPVTSFLRPSISFSKLDREREVLQGSVYTKRRHQCNNDLSDTALIENNGVTTHYGATPLI